MEIGVHISHEAAKKIGGIGSVLSGLCNTETYKRKYPRTIFYGPLFDDQSSLHPDRIGNGARILFSSLDGIEQDYPLLSDLCHRFHIDIVYGKKDIYDEIHPDHSTEVEVILIGIKRLKIESLNEFKYKLWERFRFQSDLYSDWDCEQYIRLAVPFLEVLDSLTEVGDTLTAFSHEYMGVPCCLKLLLSDNRPSRTFFYAHEVSTVRAIVEKIPGHDIAFYNNLARDMQRSTRLEERYGSHKNNYRNEMIKLAVRFDMILAVGDWIKEEYKYLQPDADEKRIKVLYNGVPTNKISYDKKQESRNRLSSYCETLFNFEPDLIFTHVTRLVISKGLWRDIRFLEEMDKYFADSNLKGFYILLSSLITTGKDPQDVERMERDYGWPLLHNKGYPDLIDYEQDVYDSLMIFNAKSKCIKGVFINQYGFSPETTGRRLPEGTVFSDLRYGSDAELGFSIYEPFGIAQIETVPFGGTAILSRQCGCSFLLDQCFRDTALKPYYCIDFAETDIEEEQAFQEITAEQRTEIESTLFSRHGKNIFEMLPRNEEMRKQLFNQAREKAESLSWEHNVKGFL